jgi:hypothetical protein
VELFISCASFCHVCRRNLEYRSSELLKKLLQAGLGSRPIVWVTHSMGGLLIKSVLTKGNFQPSVLDMTSFKFCISAHNPVFLGTHLFKFGSITTTTTTTTTTIGKILSTLCMVFTHIFLRQTMSLSNTMFLRFCRFCVGSNVRLHQHFPQYVCSAQYGSFL